jgi:hypothetical protein
VCDWWWLGYPAVPSVFTIKFGTAKYNPDRGRRRRSFGDLGSAGDFFLSLRKRIEVRVCFPCKVMDAVIMRTI